MHQPVHYERKQIVLAPYTIAPQIPTSEKQNKMKRSSEATQTLRAGCNEAEPKRNSPLRRPLPGGADRPKFNQLEMVTTCTYRPSLVSFDARNFELSWYQTHKHTNTRRPPVANTQTGPIIIHCAAKLRAQCNKTVL